MQNTYLTGLNRFKILIDGLLTGSLFLKDTAQIACSISTGYEFNRLDSYLTAS
jgi:hypothetical protein